MEILRNSFCIFFIIIFNHFSQAQVFNLDTEILGGSLDFVVSDKDDEGITHIFNLTSSKQDLVIYHYDKDYGFLLDKEINLTIGSIKDLKGIDFDNDGDTDLIIISNGGEIRLFENLDNEDIVLHTYFDFQIDSFELLEIGDINGDLLLDFIIATNSDEILFFQNSINQEFNMSIICENCKSSSSCISIVDVNNDFLNDLVFVRDETNELVILENTGGAFLEHFVDLDYQYSINAISFVDLDNNGLLDFVFAAVGDDKAFHVLQFDSWNFSSSQTIIELDHVFGVEHINYNDDEFIDLLLFVGSGNIGANGLDSKRAVIMENLNGNEFNLIDSIADFSSSENIQFVDVDNDEIQELILIDVWNKLSLYSLENGYFNLKELISTKTDFDANVSGAISCENSKDVIGLNRHSFGTIVAISDLKERKFEMNTLITPRVELSNNIHAEDLNLDGNLDLIHGETNISYQKQNEDGSFDDIVLLHDFFGRMSNLTTSDLDLNGYPDLVYSRSQSSIEIFYNYGEFQFSEPLLVNTNYSSSIYDVLTEDLNGDGFKDLIACYGHYLDGNLATNNRVSWFENIDGLSFGPEQVIEFSSFDPQDVQVANLDGDSDLDLMMKDTYNKINVYRNDGTGTFEILSPFEMFDIDQFLFSDFDLDGIGELVCQGKLYSNDENCSIYYFENNGNGIFEQSYQIGDCGSFIYSDDLDIDGDLDLISFGNSMRYFKNNSVSEILNANAVVSVYPNPIIDQLSIELSEDIDNFKLELINMNGQLCYSEILNRNDCDEIEISGFGLSTGIYILKLTAENLNFHKRMLIKRY